MKNWLLIPGLLLAACATLSAGLPEPTHPLLLVRNGNYAANPFAGYLSEILVAEGLAGFKEVELSDLALEPDPENYLRAFSVVLLAETDLSPAQEQFFRNYVAGGGNLIAMRPDSDLADLFGLTYLGVRPEELLHFFAIDTAQEPGGGLPSVSLQYHGQADNYALNEAVSLADLWSSIDVPSTNPAVTLHSYGSGRAVAFAFDLAKSVVLMRQGNPAWQNSEGDGLPGYRPADTFFRLTGETWVAPERMRIPQADEKQRFLANLILYLSSRPIPRMWYLPDGKKALLINTGDGEDLGGADFELILNDAASYGGRLTLYLRESGIANTTSAEEAAWRAVGHETGPHVYGGGPDTWDALVPAYEQIISNLWAKFGHGGRTARSHTIDWCGWVDMAKIEADNGTELDCNYYHYLPFLQGQGDNADGYFTGSGLPQRLCDEAGHLLSVYQVLTEWPDEWFDDKGYTAAQAVQVVKDMFVAAQAGNYSAFVINVHPVRYNNIGGDITHAWANEVWAYAQNNGIPIWTAERLLDFVKARNIARFENIQWTNATLSFGFSTSVSGQNLTIMLPRWIGSNALKSATFAGNPVGFSLQAIKGREYGLFTTQAATGHVVAVYGSETTPPGISGLRVENVTDTTAAIVWDTDAPANSRVDYGLNALDLDFHRSTSAFVTSHKVELSGLHPNSTYYFQVTSADPGGNTVRSGVLSFTTASSSWVQTTVADFRSGAIDGLVISEDEDGELRLPPAFHDDFSGDSLSAQWVSTNWSGGTYAPKIADGIMTVSNAGGGAYVYSAEPFYPGTTLRGRVRFSRSGSTPVPYLYFGLAGASDLTPWALIGTGYAGDQIYTSVYHFRSGDPVASPLGDLFGEWHEVKFVWESDRIEFWMDDVLRRIESVHIPRPLHLSFSSSVGTATNASVAVDWVRVENYSTSLVLSDDFSQPNVSATNWVPLMGSWSVSDNAYYHGPAGFSYHPAILSTAFPVLSNFNFQTRAMSTSPVGFFGLTWGFQDDSPGFYMAQWYPGTGLQVYRLDNWFSNFTLVGSAPAAPVPVPNQWFTLRLEARNGLYRLYVDGVLLLTVTDATYPVGRVGLMGYGGTANFYDDVLVEMLPPAAPREGVYTSTVLDAGRKAAWQSLSWIGNTPPDTAIAFETRSGNVPVPDASWSEWQPFEARIPSPESRYLQVRARLISANVAQLSPVLEQFQVNFSLAREMPQLSLSPVPSADPNRFVLRWPASAGGLVLFSTTNLQPPVVWTPVPPTAPDVDGYYEHVFSTTNPAEFFRLGTP
ncbi:MAG TPA: fibronectin type III domain-containing protein [Verrucomicrobiota bacterium]|nr:fibronectin type III domain-containing protein [Verrucomicrobiota bacterium]